MVDLTRGPHPTARLLNLVPGRSGSAYLDWLDARGEAFRKRGEIATLDPFQGYKNAIDDQLEDATCVLDTFHIVKLAGAAVDDVRRRVQQETVGHRGRKGDPLYVIRHLFRVGRERLTSRQQNRLASAFAAHPDHVAVEVAYHCAQDLRDVFHQPTLPRGRRLAEQLIEKLPSCPIPEIARLGKTLPAGGQRSWPTSAPTARATAAPRPSTGSLNSAAASPAASGTSSTTASAFSSSLAASTPHPTLNSEKPD